MTQDQLEHARVFGLIESLIRSLNNIKSLLKKVLGCKNLMQYQKNINDTK